MLQVSVVDSSAEGRLSTVHWLQQSLDQGIEGIEFLPRLAFKPVSISELKFQSAPDLIVVGPGLVAGVTDDLLHIRKTAPEIPLILIAPEGQFSLGTIEYLSRIGIEEILSRAVTPQELLRKLVMIAARVRRRSSGKLVVIDAAKGGVGATTLVSALGEIIAESGKRVLLIDGDFERQSLTRFIQARPFVNESFQALLDGTRPVTPDFIEQCVVQVWRDLPALWCMSPPANSDLSGTLPVQITRTLIASLEILDQLFDYVVVDAAATRGTYRRLMLRAADRVIFVCDSDPASAFASFERVRRIREEISPNAVLKVVENRRSSLTGLSQRILRCEFERAGGIRKDDWCSVAIPFCRKLARWPGSGMAAYYAGSRQVKRRLKTIAIEAGVPALVCNRRSWVASFLTDPFFWIQSKLGYRMRSEPKPASQQSQIPGPSPQLPWRPLLSREEVAEVLISPPQAV